MEVDGLLVNCLPCHPQNVKCHYKICNDIPKAYLETLFSPLPSEIEESAMKEEFDLPFAPSVEVETKNNILNNTKVKRSKPGKKPGVKEKEKKVHFCELCGKTFKYRKDYKEHVSAVHEKKKPYKCPRCDKHFAQQGHINGHVRAVHEGIKDHQCPLCEYRCTTKQQINSHLLAVHEGVKQYKCSWCEACFSSKHCLEGHIATGQFLSASVISYLCFYLTKI